MNKQQFIQYIAKSYSISAIAAEAIVEVFTNSMQEVITSGQNLALDNIGEFSTTSTFSDNLHLNVDHRVRFFPDEKLKYIDNGNACSY